MTYTYKTQGTCSSNIELDVEDGIVKEVAFWGGCNGNLQGLSRLVKGMPVDAVIARLEGIRCGRRSTSLPRPIVQGIARDGVLSLLPERMDESP